MPPAKKRSKYRGIMRNAVAQNLANRMALVFSEHGDKPKALSRRAGVSLSTVQRVLSGEVGASIDVLEQLADALDLSVYQLVLPCLDADNPQVVAGATAAEKRLYSSLRESIRQATEK